MVWRFSQVRVIEGQFVPREPKLVRVIGSFEKSRVREIGGEIVELEWSKSKGFKVWFEILGGSGNRVFEKSGFHCSIFQTKSTVHLSRILLDCPYISYIPLYVCPPRLRFSAAVCWNARNNYYGQFTWREGAPANRATRLEGLKHSPPLHPTHLTGIVSGLCELSLGRPLSTTNITADQGKFFPSYFSFLHRHGPVLCLRPFYYGCLQNEDLRPKTQDPKTKTFFAGLKPGTVNLIEGVSTKQKPKT